MLEFGLTGGIGSGKSTVSALLEERGAVVIDADAIVRDLQRPGELVFDAMIERWGDRVVADDGTLNRAAVAEIVFSDAAELDALNGIVHPAVAAETSRRIEQLSNDVMVVHDIPLLVLPGGELLTSRDHRTWAGIVVVDTPEELATDRVVSARGMDPDDVRARMAAQASRDDRRSVASFVIDNSKDLDALEVEVDRCWQWMTGLGRSGDAEDTEAAHITATGPEGKGAAEDTETAHITPTGLGRSGDAENEESSPV